MSEKPMQHIKLVIHGGKVTNLFDMMPNQVHPAFENPAPTAPRISLDCPTCDKPIAVGFHSSQFVGVYFRCSCGTVLTSFQ